MSKEWRRAGYHEPDVSEPLTAEAAALRTLEDFTYPAGPAPTEQETAAERALATIRVTLDAARPSGELHETHVCRDCGAEPRRVRGEGMSTPLTPERASHRAHAVAGCVWCEAFDDASDAILDPVLDAARPSGELHETHVCRDCGAEITMPYARPNRVLERIREHRASRRANRT